MGVFLIQMICIKLRFEVYLKLYFSSYFPILRVPLLAFFRAEEDQDLERFESSTRAWRYRSANWYFDLVFNARTHAREPEEKKEKRKENVCLFQYSIIWSEKETELVWDKGFLSASFRDKKREKIGKRRVKAKDLGWKKPTRYHGFFSKLELNFIT